MPAWPLVRKRLIKPTFGLSPAWRSLRWREARRCKPFTHMRCRLGLPCPAHHSLALDPGRRALGLLPKTLSFLLQAFFEGAGLFDAATLHWRCSIPVRERAVAFLSPTRAEVRAVTLRMCRIRNSKKTTWINRRAIYLPLGKARQAYIRFSRNVS